jgi:hypothetical protein
MPSTLNNIKNSAATFMDTLQGQQNTAFAGNQAALNAVSGAWGSIAAGGAIPEGYSPGLDKMLQSQIVSNSAAGTANAQDAAALQEKQAGGGNNVLPSGADAATSAEINAKGAASENTNLQAEKTADYEQGTKNLEGMTQAELGVASGENETGLASASTGSGELGESAATAQWQEDQTSSPAAILGDIGSAAGDASAILG